MAARRLSAPLHPGTDRGRPVTLVVDGRSVPAFEGEPVAVALLAAGRPVLSRSFRLHRPRGLMCSTGQCGWCECRIDDVPSVRSCRVPAADGMRVQGEHAVPSVRRDVLGLLDRGAEWVPPTFYHHRFLRPKRLRKRYLDVIRWFGGRGRLSIPPAGAAASAAAGATSTAPARPPRIARVLETDVVVVGGGPAGLLAALGAAQAGARVVVLEAEPAVGGPWRWRAEPIPGAGPLPTLIEALSASGRVTIVAGATALDLDVAGLHAATDTALLDVHARSAVVATGSYEQLPLVPGNDRPGVIGARTVESLIRRYGVVPGARAVLVGSGPDVDRAGAAIEEAGSEIAARIETDALQEVEGRGGVTGVRHRVVLGGLQREAADLVVIGDRAPAAELALAARASGSDVPVLLAGAADGRPVETGDAAEAAIKVGRTAAEPRTPTESAALAPATAEIAPVIEPEHEPRPRAARAMACFCEDVRIGDLIREGALGYAHPELLKRRTGALTGPCQGKYCGVSVHAAIAIAAPGAAALPAPTTRPPARPVRLGDLVLATADPAADPGTPREATQA